MKLAPTSAVQAIMLAKRIASKVDPGFASVDIPTFGRGAPVERANSGLTNGGYAAGGSPDGESNGTAGFSSQAGELSDGRGISGSGGVLQAPDGQRGSSPLEGLPQQVKIPATGQVISAGPAPHVRNAAASYMQSRGLPYRPPTKYVKVDPERAAMIAKAYEEMPHDPEHPLVKASYDALIDEVTAQYQHAKAHGLKVDFWDPDTQEDPYAASPRLANEDIRHNNHMFVFPTSGGYGQDGFGEEDIKHNPMLRDTGERWGGKPVLANDLFRVVHDYFGHAKEGLGFRDHGEENAWLQHSAMFSPLARIALTGETRGQNSHVNYGPHGEHNRSANSLETRYAPQKTGAIAPWVLHSGVEDQMEPGDIQQIHDLYAAHQRKRAAGGEVDPSERKANLDRFMEGNHPLVPHVLYHGTDRDISKFELDKTRRIDGGMGAENYDTGWFGKGHYLTAKPSVAGGYAGKDEGANVLPLHPSLKNPFIVRGVGGMDMDRAISLQYSDAPPQPQQGRLPSVQTAFLKSKGHDGVIAVDPEGYMPNEFVVFDGKQLKSAIGNEGGFDPSTSRIDKAEGGEVDAIDTDDEGKTIPESAKTLEHQRQLLLEGRRKAVMYPKGGNAAPEAPDGAGVTITPHGTFHFNPALVTEEQIHEASRQSRLNEILGMGAYSKKDIAKRIEQGERPVAIVARDSEGHEVISAAGTHATADEQIEAMRHQVPEGGSIGVEYPEQVIRDRQAVHRAFGGQIDPGSPNNISFEAVPGEGYDPEMKQRMQALPEHHISDITTALQGEFLPHIMKAAGAQGQIMPQLGGWMGDTNPSRVMQVRDPDKANLVAHIAGHVFRQDGMMHVSATPHDGSTPHGATRVILPKGTSSKDVSSIYKKIYDHMGPNSASGHSTNLSNGTMDIIHNPEDSKLTPEEHAAKIAELLGPNYDTKSQDAHVSFPGIGDYTDGVSGAYKGRGSRTFSGEGTVDNLQARAKERLEGYIAASEAQADKKGRLRLPTVFPHEAGPTSVSTRLPTTKGAIASGAIPAPGGPYQLQTDSASQRQAIADHNALLANNTHPGLKPTDDPDEAREAYLDLSKRNLLAIHDRFSPEARATSSGWYRAANYVGRAIAHDHGLAPQAGHAIVAVLSPQNPWDNNVSMAERVADTLANGQNHPWTPKMDEVGARIFNKDKDLENLSKIKGKTLGELKSDGDDHTLQAMWIRAFDEAHNTKQYKSIDPSGQFTTTNKNPYTWFSTGPISKAVSIFHNPSIENISQQLGEKNKVRSFYENISDPEGPNAVTADTHAVAASQGRPLGSGSDAVNHNFGTSPEKKKQTAEWRSARNDAETGLHGTYGLTADATRMAAHERGIRPQQMQSITWEGARNLFEGKKGKKYQDMIDGLWNQYRDGELSHHEVWDEIERVMGGIKKPSWAAAGVPVGPGEGRSYSGPLAMPSNPASVRKAPDVFAKGGAVSKAIGIAMKAQKRR